MADKRLGKGLDALIPSYATDDRHIDGAVPLTQIIPNRNQPRQEFNPEQMEELTASIKENGILQPLTVRELEGGDFELIAGERRLRAAKDAGLETVPVYILSVDADVEMMEYALVENIQRVDLKPLEKAEGYAILSGKYDLSQDDIAKRVGKSRPAIANALRLLKLPPEIKSSLNSGKISTGHALAILGLRKSLQMMTLHQKVVREELSVRQTEALVKKYSESFKNNLKVKIVAPKQSDVIHIENELISLLGTKVAIKKNQKGKGKIQIEFYSENDFQRILEIISGSEKKS
ncbi:MAG TPA: ParB/RepB/Spo0J family partition protein [Candidatus Marinimicrobia bacterium]|jgi:ParB family chromosome partitioning protein|nr:ParB/RepB/Spo0J family partition protein [Candidatus Neomarinimicrobiota bacterium]HIB14873.1 ParB/RepB/Spo0J family partition protein [Candidatus Neomarinimicrobiota bacterium]HIG51361.1 ParB/RepB/Spo0J family partition protein [Candidatus Neomarinimicrobiota bacterium]HIM53482.1 ParB/RepB/Spo0J family partition protein [Candidatus Neomarinimicrobiota bacterium]